MWRKHGHFLHNLLVWNLYILYIDLINSWSLYCHSIMAGPLAISAPNVQVSTQTRGACKALDARVPLQRPFQAVSRGRSAALTSRRQVAVLRSATEEEGEASHSNTLSCLFQQPAGLLLLLGVKESLREFVAELAYTNVA